MFLGNLKKLDHDGFYKCTKIGIKIIMENCATGNLIITSYFEGLSCQSTIEIADIERVEMDLRDRINMILLEHYNLLIKDSFMRKEIYE